MVPLGRLALLVGSSPADTLREQALETSKESLGITEYSCSQATLEGIFLRFAKEQGEGETGRVPSQA